MRRARPHADGRRRGGLRVDRAQRRGQDDDDAHDARADRADVWQIEIMGIDVHEQPHEVARMVGFMPDFPPVYEDLLVWEFLDLFAASYRIPRWSRPETDRPSSDDGRPEREARCR